MGYCFSSYMQHKMNIYFIVVYMHFLHESRKRCLPKGDTFLEQAMLNFYTWLEQEMKPIELGHVAGVNFL
jgi:hypothetical protein